MAPSARSARHVAAACPRAAVRPFSAASVWNAPLSAHALLDPQSGGYVRQLVDRVRLMAPGINTSAYTTPIYTVGPGAPAVRVRLDGAFAPLQAAWERVPLPAGARPSAGTDQQLTLLQPATDTLWEFWGLQLRPDGWHARWGGRMDGLSRNPGYFTGSQSSWGATATSLPLIGGLIRIAEGRRGVIDHALSFAMPGARREWFSWPAQRTDGSDPSPDAIPEGTRFRLDPKLNVDALGLPPLARAMARAAQRYGIVLRDQAPGIVFVAEQAQPGQADPWYRSGGIFAGLQPWKLLERFPWDHLQALKTQQACCWRR
jgi:hypothetical protein